MAIFGRNTARQRLRRAARESLKIPAFNSPVDCTPWVTGGLWPAELSTVTADTAPLVTYLKTDLQRIVNSANAELKVIRRAGLADSTRQAEEARVIADARAFAVRRVESTVRHLRDVTSNSPARNVNGTDDVDSTQPLTAAAPHPEPDASEAAEVPTTYEPTPAFDDLLAKFDRWEPPVLPVPAVEDTEPPRHPAVPPPAAAAEPEHERLERLLKFVARQEPGLRWAVGIRDDGTTLLVTDLAHGWIPPGITLPAEVRLLAPARRTGTASALLGKTSLSATYAPGDPLGWATDYEVTNTSSQPRDLPAVDDLGWLLNEATHWRDGLPRMVNTLAKAGTAGTGIVDAEIDILRVHLDTTRYKLLAQYPDVDAGLLLNCLLLAATESVATKSHLDANYHVAWFRVLSVSPASGWKAGA